MTRRQWEVLAAIKRMTEPRGPTIRELATALGVSSPCTIQQHIQALRRQGLVTIRPGSQSRGVVLTEEGQAVLRALRDQAGVEMGKAKP